MASDATLDVGLVGGWSKDHLTGWARLALYLHWRGEKEVRLDGTNNVTEQVIGQSFKERYRTMRGYQREQSILNVSSLIGWVGIKGADYELAELLDT